MRNFKTTQKRLRHQNMTNKMNAIKNQHEKKL